MNSHNRDIKNLIKTIVFQKSLVLLFETNDGEIEKEYVLEE